MRATPENKRVLTDFLAAAETDIGTDYAGAFAAAFDMLQRTADANVGSGCASDKIVLFLTDGQPDDPAALLPDHPLRDTVKIFTYLVGRPTDPTAAHDIACASGGSFATVSDVGSIGDVMGDYYKHLGHGSAGWTLPYYGSSQGQLMATYAIPVYSSGGATTTSSDDNGDSSSNSGSDDKNNNNEDQSNEEEETTQTLLGVVGVDLPLAFAEEALAKVAEETGNNAYAFMVDTEGNAVFHPGFEAAPTLRFFDVELLETVVDTADFVRATRKATAFYTTVRRGMVDGVADTRPLTVARNSLPAGVRTLDVTYVFAPVAGTPFSVATVWPTNNVQQLLLPDEPAGGWHANVVLPNFTPYAASAALAPGFAVTETAHMHAGERVSLTHGAAHFAPALYCSAAAAQDVPFAAQKLADALRTPSVPAPTCDDSTGSSTAAFEPRFARPAVRLASSFVARWAETFADTANSRFSSWAYYADAHGTFVVYPGTEFGAAFDARARPWYQRALAAGGTAAVSTPYAGTSAAGQVLVSLARAVVHDGVALGVVGSDVQLGVLQDALRNASGGRCAVGSATTHCYLVDDLGMLVAAPTFDPAAPDLADVARARFLGEDLGPVVARLVDDGILLPHDVVVPNMVCTQEEEEEEEEGGEGEGNAGTTSPGPFLRPAVDTLLEALLGNRQHQQPQMRARTQAQQQVGTTRSWPCLYHQTYYTVDRARLEESVGGVYSALLSHPCATGAATLAAVPNTTLFLLVFEGDVGHCSTGDAAHLVLEPLGREEVLAQRFVDRRGPACPRDVARACLMCPGLNETGIVCAGRGDCIDGVCHCHGGNTTPYCSNPAGAPQLSRSLLVLSLLTLALAAVLPSLS